MIPVEEDSLPSICAKEKTVRAEHDFLVPDYYLNFTCKGPDCRDSCCRNWNVTISMPEYFLLHGLQTDKNLKGKIDRSFRPILNPTREKYAEIAHNHLGDCPLHMDNGLCQLHHRLGEKVMPGICRYYPRGQRVDIAYEASCSNSCEKTLELLFASDALITFETRRLPIWMQSDSKPVAKDSQTEYARTRELLFGILGDRTLPLVKRIMLVGKALYAMDDGSYQDLSSIRENEAMPDPDATMTIEKMMQISRWFIENRPTIASFCQQSETYFSGTNLKESYAAATLRMDEILPLNEIWFEKMLINNLFFRQFPFQDGTKNYPAKFVSLCGTFVFLRYLALGMMNSINSLTDFVDLMSTLFSVITHSRFEHNIALFLGNEEADDFTTLMKMIQI